MKTIKTVLFYLYNIWQKPIYGGRNKAVFARN